MGNIKKHTLALKVSACNWMPPLFRFHWPDQVTYPAWVQHVGKKPHRKDRELTNSNDSSARMLSSHWEAPTLGFPLLCSPPPPLLHANLFLLFSLGFYKISLLSQPQVENDFQDFHGSFRCQQIFTAFLSSKLFKKQFSSIFTLKFQF